MILNSVATAWRYSPPSLSPISSTRSTSPADIQQTKPQMVFSDLSSQEKDAFFSLLDELRTLAIQDLGTSTHNLTNPADTSPPVQTSSDRSPRRITLKANPHRRQQDLPFIKRSQTRPAGLPQHLWHFLHGIKQLRHHQPRNLHHRCIALIMLLQRWSVMVWALALETSSTLR